MELLIKEIRIVDSYNDFIGDIYIRNGVIEKVGENLKINCNTIGGEGLVALPSFVDFHSHFREPGFTEKEDILSGSKAAVKGGYTAVNLMANTNPVCSSMEIVDYVLSKAKDIGLIDIYQTVTITNHMNGKDINHLDGIGDTVKFISDDGRGVISNRVMLEAMLKAKELGLSVISHPEDEELTQIDYRISEDLMTQRDIALAKYTDVHLHLAHVSTEDSMKAVIAAKKEGTNVTCEVTPHHLALTDDIKYKVNPPLRNEVDRSFLINSIKEGWVDMIATDHAPHTKEDKKNGAPGISGLESAFSICYTTLVKEGHISLKRLSELMSSNPAKLLKLNKGQITEGFDGDLVLVDLNRKIVVKGDSFVSKGKNTPFENMVFWGSIVKTIKGGKIVYEGEWPNYDNR